MSQGGRRLSEEGKKSRAKKGGGKMAKKVKEGISPPE